MAKKSTRQVKCDILSGPEWQKALAIVNGKAQPSVAMQRACQRRKERLIKNQESAMRPSKKTTKKKFLVMGVGVFETEATDELKCIKPAVLKVIRAKGKSETYCLPVFTIGFSRSSAAVCVGRKLIEKLVDADKSTAIGRLG
jgi:hypothetical protein